MNTINSSDFNTSFDKFVHSVRLASNGEINWNLNDIDTSQFKSLVESIRCGDKNNWNISSNQFANLASSLSNFFAQSGIMQKVNNSNGTISINNNNITISNNNNNNNINNHNKLPNSKFSFYYSLFILTKFLLFFFVLS